MILDHTISSSRKTLLAMTLACAYMLGPQTAQSSEPVANLKTGPIWAFAIHGGAAGFTRETWDQFEKKTGASQEQYRAVLTEALHAGAAVLKENGNALDAVETAIVILED